MLKVQCRQKRSSGRFRLRPLLSVGIFLMLLAGWVVPASAADGPEPGSGKRLPRMYVGAPPQVPHSVAGLEGACLGCHLEGAQGATPVPHPDRPNCQQCHISQHRSVKPLVENGFSGKPIPPSR
jgi:nitrate reductase cytochrome c-type subunit